MGVRRASTAVVASSQECWALGDLLWCICIEGRATQFFLKVNIKGFQSCAGWVLQFLGGCSSLLLIA